MLQQDGRIAARPMGRACINDKGSGVELDVIMYHCHILEHEDIGMMGMWHITGDGIPM